MMLETVAGLIGSLKNGDHLCCIYGSEEERCALLVPFIAQGTQRGERVLWIPGNGDRDAVMRCLEEGDIDAEECLGEGRLLVHPAEHDLAEDCMLRLHDMMRMLESESEKAVSEGYEALSVAGELGWMLEGSSGFETLVAYEAGLHEFLPGKKITALWQYDRSRLEPEILLGVLATHPIAVLGTEIYRNIYYTAPEDLLAGRLPQVMLESWIKRLQYEKGWHSELEEKEARYRNLFDSISSGVAVYEAVDGGSDFVFVDYNRAGEVIDSVKGGELIGRRLTEAFPGAVELGLLAVIRRVWESGEPEYMPARPYGDTRIAGWRENYVYRLPSGEVVAVYDDVTERIEATSRLMEAYRELDRFSGAVSHDLGGGLAFVESFIEAAQKAAAGEDVEGLLKNLESARSALVELESYIGSLLRYAREQYSEAPAVSTNTDDVLAKIIRDMGMLLKEHGVEIEVTGDLPNAAVDPSKLRQVFVNLLNNAVHHGGVSDLAIEVGATLGGDQATFYVRDNGVGIQEDLQALVFLPYRRLGQEKAPNMGMGLSIVKRAVESWGGRIWLESRPMQGCVFRFTVPTA